jgi:hypothetical protein
MIVSEAEARARIAEQGGSVSSRFGIAAQALGVAALAALVYFAFLQPSDPDPLSGIEVEGDFPTQVTAGDGKAARSQGRRGASTSRRGASAGAGAGAGSVPLIRLVPVVPGSSSPVPPTLADNETPVGTQYDSAVARIIGRASGARPE